MKRHHDSQYEHLFKEFALFPVSAEKRPFMHPPIVMDEAPETDAVAVTAMRALTNSVSS